MQEVEKKAMANRRRKAPKHQYTALYVCVCVCQLMGKDVGVVIKMSMCACIKMGLQKPVTPSKSKCKDDFIFASRQSSLAGSVVITLFTVKRHLHRVDIVLSFFSSRRNWDSPAPFGSGGRGTLALLERVCPNPTRGHTPWCSRHISTLWSPVCRL